MYFAQSANSRPVLSTALVLVGCAVLGIVAVQVPLAAAGAVVAGALLLAVNYCRRWIAFHEALVLGALTAYIVLNYGFDNLGVRLGPIPLLAGHAMLLTGFVVVARAHRGAITQALREPAVKWLLVLATLTVFHLLADVPRFGAIALRDASIILEGVFLGLGLLWGRDTRLTRVLLRWLPILFLINLLYSFTFPWQMGLQAHSQIPGAFQQTIPFLGNYQLNMVYLLLGTFFFLWLGLYLTRRPTWWLYGLAIAQLFGLAILQDRTMIVAMGVIVAFVILIGQWRLSARLLPPAGIALAALLTVTVLGVAIPGRVGPVTSDFVQKYAGTVLHIGERGREWGTDADRQKWFDQVWSTSTSNTNYLIWGRGFGEPLIDFRQRNGVVVRQPHNSTLSIFARLGLVGVVAWVGFLLSILKRFARPILHRDRLTEPAAMLVIWLFCLLMVNLLFTTVQPAFEFSHGAITFYFFAGFSLGFLRSQIEPVLAARDAVSRRPLERVHVRGSAAPPVQA